MKAHTAATVKYQRLRSSSFYPVSLFSFLQQKLAADLTEVELTLPATEFGVELTKDAGGVTAVFTDTNSLITTVFYDGTVLHIRHAGTE